MATDPITMLHIADDAQYPYPAQAYFIPILLTVATVATWLPMTLLHYMKL